MARQSSILIPSADSSIVIQGLANNTTSAAQKLGKNRIFVINSDQDLMIQFGLSTGTQTGPSATVGYRIPANQQDTYDTGQAFDQFEVFNLGTANGSGGQTGTSSANVYIEILSVV